MARYVFVTGGVVSSLGKGLSSASLASLLQLRGFNVRVRKLVTMRDLQEFLQHSLIILQPEEFTATLFKKKEEEII